MTPNILLRALNRYVEVRSGSKRRLRFTPELEMLEDRMAPAVFTVTNNHDDGAGSLRIAIASANAAPSVDRIEFNIVGPLVINLASALPTLTGKVTIAGDTQPGFAGQPLIELNGAAAGPGANGLVMKASGCLVSSLVINNFGGSGILELGSSGVIEGCYIGTNNAGNAAMPNQYYGVLITGGASGVRVGSTDVAKRNVISGNAFSGVAILGPLAKNNLIQGNYIGTNRLGNLAVPNLFDGVVISGGAKTNTIGGLTANAGNLISGNNGNGVNITDSGTTGNLVQGNLIGTNLAGNGILGNGDNGVAIQNGAASNNIGGSAAAARNIISGNHYGVAITDASSASNSVLGNYIGINLAGNAPIPNVIGVYIADGAKNNTVGGTAAGTRNVISGNIAFGVSISAADTTGNKVLGNFIGTDAVGTGGIANGKGVYIENGAASNIIGGTVAGARNVISGNNVGVDITDAGTTKNLIQGNYIGVDTSGNTDLGNTLQGVLIEAGASSNTVGGIVAGARNVISGNNASGVKITGAGTTGNFVQGNYIGTNAAGNTDVGNSFYGVLIDSGAASNTIGGTVAAARNVISGNGFNGVLITDAASDYNLVQGNYIGTNAAGTADLGNLFFGVAIVAGAADNTIGGTLTGARNIISGNNVGGVLISGVGSDYNNVEGNYIGTNAAGTADLGNTFDGVLIQNGAAHALIGGSAPGTMSFGRGNVISGNDRFCVIIWNAATTDNFIGSNLIGLAANGKTPMPNASHGVFITDSASGNLIGSNRIAYNGGDGVLIGSDPGNPLFLNPAGSSNTVFANLIYNNAGDGIDLGPNDGPTPNDVNDVDIGPNDLLNTPVFTSAFLSGATLILSGFMNTQANKDLVIQLYANPSGGQGQIQLGFIPVSMGPNNTVFFTKTLTVPSTVVKGYTLTAIAIDQLGNSSEFSIPLVIE